MSNDAKSIGIPREFVSIDARIIGIPREIASNDAKIIGIHREFVSMDAKSLGIPRQSCSVVDIARFWRRCSLPPRSLVDRGKISRLGARRSSMECVFAAACAVLGSNRAGRS